MAFNLADMFEHSVDVIPDRLALVCGDDRCTYAELEARSNRLAHHLIDAGISPGDHIGIYGMNSIQWVEALLAVLKVRAVPVNINYRYVEEELRYLFDNADLVGLVYSEQFGPQVSSVTDVLSKIKTLVMIEDGSGASQGDLKTHSLTEINTTCPAERDFGERSGDDQVIIYTGGTTGMPKGVMWRGEDIFFALAGGTNPLTRERVKTEWDHAETAKASEGQMVMMITAPMMHGAAFVAGLMNLFQGTVTVFIPKFDPPEIWRTIAREKVNTVMIVGDAMGRPLIEALEELDAAGEELDLSAMFAVASSAAVFSPAVKDRFLERMPNLFVTDSIGATESGFNGLIAVSKDNTAMKGGGPTVQPGRDTVVLDADLNLVEPGSGVVGTLARGGNIPLGYYKDPEKTAGVFVVAKDGKRYSMPGDSATVEADGTITLLGRGSVSINTGGEKVFPEEVEQALKAHPDVFDALVVGVADERWGQRVAAVVQPRPGRKPTLDDLVEECRKHIAGYKIPRELHVVDEVTRSPSGKPDYVWAKKVAEAANAVS